MATGNMMVDVMLDCGCTLGHAIESIVALPNIGQMVMCGKHKNAQKIVKVGQPYRDVPGYNEPREIPNDTDNIIPMFKEGE